MTRPSSWHTCDGDGYMHWRGMSVKASGALHVDLLSARWIVVHPHRAHEMADTGSHVRG